MNAVSTKIAALALALLAASTFAVHAESAMVRNCTWCHGGSAQGYTPAPRLAGQRASYIEQQLVSFADHTRDSPFSKQYMWGAAANLGPQAARDLAVYFSRSAASGGLATETGSSCREVKPSINGACRRRTLPHALLAMAQTLKALVRFHGLGGLDYNYLKEGLSNGPGISRSLGASDAAHCDPAVTRSNRRAGFIS